VCDGGGVRCACRPLAHEPRSGRSSNVLWGAYAYAPSPRACSIVLDGLRHDFRTRLFKQKRRGPIKAQPFDRTMPSLLREAAAPLSTADTGREAEDKTGILIADAPLFFRAPIPSVLHPVRVSGWRRGGPCIACPGADDHCCLLL
jgi:hypothetical protein